jgi:PBP1b-binding outer membrane lipoprotein LpoB
MKSSKRWSVLSLLKSNLSETQGETESVGFDSPLAFHYAAGSVDPSLSLRQTEKSNYIHMKTIISKTAQILGVTILSVIASLSMNFVISAMFAIITMSPLMGIVGSNVMLVFTFFVFVFLLYIYIDTLISKK